MAQPPEVTAPVDLPGDDPASGSEIIQGFPVGSAIDALASALPTGASVGDLPMDIGWRAGGLLEVPIITTAGTSATVTIQIADGRCTATVDPADMLSEADLAAIADKVCAEWVALKSPPIIPADPSGEERPDLAAQ